MNPAALPRESNAGQPPQLPTRADVLDRYRHLRKIAKHHHTKALDLLAPGAIIHHLRRLGLCSGKKVVVGSEDELTFAFDLAIYTAPPGRSRTLDRLARKEAPRAGSDEGLMLDAMRNARFAVLIVQRPHRLAGLVLTDIFRDEEIWLVDEGLEVSLEEGAAYATRYYTPGPFSMTAGVGVPVHRRFLMDAIEEHAPHLIRKPPDQLIDNPRFAEAIYRTAVREGLMEDVLYLDPPAEGYAA